MYCEWQVSADQNDLNPRKVFNFKILFKEGGVGTFIPLFFNLLHAIRAVSPRVSLEGETQQTVDPLPEQSVQVDDVVQHA